MFSILALATHILVSVNAVGDAYVNGSSVAEKEPLTSRQVAKVRHISVPGDLILGGVFPVHWKSDKADGDPCGGIAETRGVHRVEAMLYALDVINSKPDFLRGYKLGALILDSCSNPAYALNQSLDFVRELIGSTDANEYQCRDGSQPISRLVPRRNVVAVVGGSYSSVTVQVANLLRLFRIVQVSPASTNADLSDKTRFEFFARTVPSDNYQARAMISIAKEFNWTYVSLMYSADEYGELGAEAFKKEARKENICIATEERVQNKRQSIMESIDNIIKKLYSADKDKAGAEVVVLFVGTDYVAEIMNQAAQRMKLQSMTPRKKIIWLAAEGWDRNNEAYVQGQRRLAAQGAIVLMLSSQTVPQFNDYFTSLRPGTDQFERNKWLRELWMSKFDCEFNLPPDSTGNRCEDHGTAAESFIADDKVQYVIDAVYALAHALKSYKEEVCPEEYVAKEWMTRKSDRKEVCAGMKNIDGSKLYSHLLKVKFDDVVGKKVHFTAEGDGPASYTILNYQPHTGVKRRRQNPEDSLQSNYVEVGNWIDGHLEINHSKMLWGDKVPISRCARACEPYERKQMIKDEVCCWACTKCEDWEYRPNETHCVDCGPGRWPLKNRTGCYNLSDKQLMHMKWSSWYSIGPVIVATIGICAALFVIFVFIKYNDTPIVKASGRELCYILLIAVIMCYVMTFVLLAKPTKLVCGLKRAGIGFAFSCLYSAMFVKTNRIARIFSQATRSAARPGCISPISQVFLTACLAGVQLLGSLVWLFIVPPGTRHDYPARKQVVLTCNVPDHHFLYSLAYDAGLIVLTTIYAVKTRKVPENFNETKFIAFSMYTTCVLWVSWIFFFFGTGTDFQIQTTSLCVSISMSANVVLACIFSPKLWIIFFEKHKNVRKQDGEYMLAKRNTLCGTHSEEATPYTALLAQQRRKPSRRITPPSTNSSAQDTFL